VTGVGAAHPPARHLRGQHVSLCTVGQFVFAGAMGWIFFRESPAPLFYAASALVVAGIVIAILNTSASRSHAQVRLR